MIDDHSPETTAKEARLKGYLGFWQSHKTIIIAPKLSVSCLRLTGCGAEKPFGVVDYGVRSHLYRRQRRSVSSCCVSFRRINDWDDRSIIAAPYRARPSGLVTDNRISRVQMHGGEVQSQQFPVPPLAI